jgi:hypothetical protein
VAERRSTFAPGAIVSLWVYVRVALIVGAAVQACFAPLEPHARPPIGWGALAAIFGVCSLGFVLVLGIQRVNPLSEKTWHRPSWALNPFNFRDPLQFFDLGAYVCLAGAFVTIIRLAFSAVPFYAESLVPLAMGGGLFLGIHIIPIVFRSKFSTRPSDGRGTR